MHTTNYLRIKEQIEAAKISTQKVEYFKSLRNVERFFIITAIGFYLSLPFLLKNLEVELYFAKYQSLIEHFKIKNTQGASFSTVFPQYIKTLPEWMIPPVVTKFFSGGSLSENEKSELRKFLELSGNVKVTGDLKSVIENSLSERPDKTFLRYRNKSIIEYINKNNLLWNAGEFSLGDFQKKVKSAISLPDPKYCTESSSLDKGVERCTIFLDAYLSFSEDVSKRITLYQSTWEYWDREYITKGDFYSLKMSEIASAFEAKMAQKVSVSGISFSALDIVWLPFYFIIIQQIFYASHLVALTNCAVSCYKNEFPCPGLYSAFWGWGIISLMWFFTPVVLYYIFVNSLNDIAIYNIEKSIFSLLFLIVVSMFLMVCYGIFRERALVSAHPKKDGH